MENSKNQSKKNFSLTSMFIIGLIFIIMGALVRSNMSAVAGDALSTVGNIFILIWIIKGIIYLHKKNNTPKESR